MTNLLRVVLLIVGLFLIAVAVAGFFDIQTGALSRESIAYFSPQDGTTATATATLSDINNFMTATLISPATATVAAAFTQIAAPTQTAVPTTTPLPMTTPTHLPSGTQIATLGRHIVQADEYIYCIGRAYGVAPEAIADINGLSSDATLFIGKELLIPDVPWIDMPPGRVCKSQFSSPYLLTPTPTFQSLTSQFPAKFSINQDSSNLEKLQLLDFVSPSDKVNKRSLPSVTLGEVTQSDDKAETRTVTVDMPTQMRLGASSQVLLTFNPETGQPTVTVTTSAGETSAAATATHQSGRQFFSSNPLEIPGVFDKFRVIAVARLDAAGFNYSPEGDVEQEVSLGKGLTWRWSIKPQDAEPQELIIKLRLHYEARAAGDFRADEELWSDSFNVNVTKNLISSLFGTQASIFTGFTFVTGSILSVFSIWDKIRPSDKKTIEQTSANVHKTSG